MKKIITLSVATLISAAALVTPAQAQGEWFLEGTQIIAPADAEFDENDVLTFYLINRHRDYQGPEVPHYVITDRKANAMFTVGGFVNFRTAVDMQAVMPNLDFVPAVIPMQKNLTNTARILMDGSTSRVFAESIIKTRWGGPMTAYVEADFRGDGGTLRMRQGYISYYGFKFGKATSTFTDINSAFNTIDFEGPNAFSYTRNLMVQYTHNWENGLGVGIAVEYPQVEATYGTYDEAMYQRFPDVPGYIQYRWGEGCTKSHIRVSGLLRTMTYTDLVKKTNDEQVGWGVQGSGTFGIGEVVRLYGQFLYGKGISQYVQDLQGLPYDMVSSATTDGNMMALPTIAWFAGAEFHLTDKMPLTVGYSQVKLDDKDNLLADTDYYLGQYIVANCFYNFGAAMSVGVEYLYGIKHNVADARGNSQRVQAAVQFNF